jgi:hypothetical protein
MAERALLVSDNTSKNVVRPFALRVFPPEFADILGLPRSTNLATYKVVNRPIIYEDGGLRIETNLKDAMEMHRQKLNKASKAAKKRNAM